MKKRIWFVLLLASILAFAACSKNSSSPDISGSRSAERLPEPTFPLEKEMILDTIDQLGLSCVISEDESQEFRSTENAIYSNHVLRDREKKYHEDSESTVLYGAIISGFLDGHRYLSATLDSRSHMLNGKPFAWEDWKQSIVFLTTLYGNFEDEEEVYRALSKLETPEDGKGFQLGVQLSNGYCAVQKSSSASPSESYALWIYFFETQELYEKREQKKKELAEKARQDTQSRREAFLQKQREKAAAADASKK